jgi:hypothetical protein
LNLIETAEEKAKEEAIMFRWAAGSLLTVARPGSAGATAAAVLAGGGGAMAYYFKKGPDDDERNKDEDMKARF